MGYSDSAEFEGKNLEETIEKALAELGKTREEVEVEVIGENTGVKTKFFGFSVKNTKIRVHYNQQELPLSPIAQKGRDFINQILDDLELDGRVERVDEGESLIEYDIFSKNPKIIIGRRGNLLEAIQSLAYMIANKDEAHWKRIIVDVDGYRRKKEDKTREMIEDIAYNVRRSRKPYLTPLYSASERRIIHMVIQEIDGVSSESEGEGMYKRVWIRPE